MYFSFHKRISDYGSYHDFTDITEYNWSHKILDGTEWVFCSTRMPHYDFVKIGGETHKFLNEETPVYYANRIKDTLSTAYLDYKAQDGGYWLDFIAYGDKTERGSGRGAELLDMALEHVFCGSVVRGSVPLINTQTGPYERLLAWYRSRGFTEYDRTSGDFGQAFIEHLPQKL